MAAAVLRLEAVAAVWAASRFGSEMDPKNKTRFSGGPVSAATGPLQNPEPIDGSDIELVRPRRWSPSVLERTANITMAIRHGAGETRYDCPPPAGSRTVLSRKRCRCSSGWRTWSTSALLISSACSRRFGW